MTKTEQIKAAVGNYLDEQDKLYPDRHKVIHKSPCQYCPSTKEPDPESLDIKTGCSKAYIAKEMLFVCAWRPSKLCKGLCDFMEIDQEYLDTVIHNKDEKNL